MNKIIMDALTRGFAMWVDSFFKSAARKGLAILILIGVIIGLCSGLLYMQQWHLENRKEWKAEMKELKAEHSEQLNDLRTQIATCDLERRELAVRVAELTVMINRKLKR